MRLLGELLGMPVKVYGPETHITEIVPLALGITTHKSGANEPVVPQNMPVSPGPNVTTVPGASIDSAIGTIHPGGERTQPDDQIVHFNMATGAQTRASYRPFDADARSFVYGSQHWAIQGMPDFDYSCGREKPSVAAMIYPFGGHHIQKFY